MKRINEILKSLNFPNFYYKEKGKLNEPLYIFGNENYDYIHYIKLIESLPFTENTIHEDDIEFIIQFLNNSLCYPTLNSNVTLYLLKLVDNKAFGESTPKVDNIVKSFTKILRKVVGIAEPKPKHSCSCSKETNDIQEKLLTPVLGMLETLAGSMLETIEKNEKKEEDNEVKIPKFKIPRCEKFDYNIKNPSHMITALEMLPIQEKYINKKDIKYIQKLMKDCVKTAKNSKKFKKALISYLLSILDSSTLGEDCPKIQKAFKNKDLGKLVRSHLDKDAMQLSDFEQDDRIRQLEKENKKLNKKLKKAKK